MDPFILMLAMILAWVWLSDDDDGTGACAHLETV